MGGPGKPDYLWLQGPNQWPPGLPELPGIIAEWDAALAAVARSLLRHWAASLGSPSDAFDAAFAERAGHPDQDRALPGGRGQGPRKAWVPIAMRECSRCCWLSRAAGDCKYGRAGTAVAADDGWIDVPVRDGAFIVNIGELLELATGGYLRATEHRVNLRHAGIGSRCPTSSTRGWTRGSRPCRCQRSWRRAQVRARTRPTRSSRFTVATPGRAGYGRTPTSPPCTATRRTPHTLRRRASRVRTAKIRSDAE